MPQPLNRSGASSRRATVWATRVGTMPAASRCSIPGGGEGQGGVAEGGVVVGLQLAGGDRVVDHAATFVDDGGVGVLPSLVLDPGRRAGAVFEEAVAVQVGVAFQPVQDLPGHRQQVTDGVAVAGPGEILPEENQEVRWGGPVAVVAAERVHAQQ